MKEVLERAVSEIQELRRINELQAAQIGIVDVFAAALGLRKHGGAMAPDVCRDLEEIVSGLEQEDTTEQDNEI